MKARFLLLLPTLLALGLLPPTAASAADASIDSTVPVAVESWQPNRIDVFARGTDGTLKHKVFNGRWSSWASLGGAITSGPAVVSRAAGHLDVFARGVSGDVQHRAYVNGTWSTWESLGGFIVGEPAAASWSSDRLDLVVRGGDNGVYQKSWNSGSWTGWWPLGGITNASPTAVSWGPNRLDIFVRGLNNSLWHLYWAGGWSAWGDLGGYITSSPAAISGSPGFITVYVRDVSQLVERVYGFGQWGGWTGLGGGLITAHAAAAWDAGHNDVFAFTTGGNLMQRTWNGYFGWTGWTTVPDSHPVRPVTPYTPTVAVQAAPAAGALVGGLAYAYVDNIGRIVSGYQADPANIGSVQWTVISGNEGFTGPPALIEQSDGRLQVSGLHLSGDVWARAQTAKAASTWTDWINQGGTMASAVTVATQTDGSVVVLALDSAGGLWYISQPSVSGPYRAWTSLGVTGVSALPTAVAGRDGLHLFVIDGAGTMKTAKLSPSGTVSAWTSLGGTGLTGTPAAVVYPGYRMRVFARAANGTVMTKEQDGALAWPQSWSPVGPAGIAVGSPAAVLSPLSGRTEVVVRGAGGAVFSTGETTQGSGLWRDWVPVLQGVDSAATDPTILSYNDGSALRWAFLFRTSDQQSRMYTVDTGFSGFSAMRAASAEHGPAFTAASLPAPPR